MTTHSRAGKEGRNSFPCLTAQPPGGSPGSGRLSAPVLLGFRKRLSPPWPLSAASTTQRSPGRRVPLGRVSGCLLTFGPSGAWWEAHCLGVGCGSHPPTAACAGTVGIGTFWARPLSTPAGRLHRRGSFLRRGLGPGVGSPWGAFLEHAAVQRLGSALVSHLTRALPALSSRGSSLCRELPPCLPHRPAFPSPWFFVASSSLSLPTCSGAPSWVRSSEHRLCCLPRPAGSRFLLSLHSDARRLYWLFCFTA